MQFPRFIIYKDKKYFQKYPNPRNGQYYHRSKVPKGVEASLHRRIWADNFGPIPKGYVIHHKNEDTLDNSIENLELMKRSDHQSFHMKKLFNDPVYREENKQHLLKVHASENFKSGCLRWSTSKEGRAFLSKKAKLDWKNAKKYPCVCIICSKTFESYRKTKLTCSERCYGTARRYEKRPCDLIPEPTR